MFDHAKYAYDACMTTTPDETPATTPASSYTWVGSPEDLPELPADWLPEGNAASERAEILVTATLTLTVGDENKEWYVEVVTKGKALVAAKNAVNIVAEDARGWVLDERDKERS